MLERLVGGVTDGGVVEVFDAEAGPGIGDAVKNHALHAQAGDTHFARRVKLAAPLDGVQQQFAEGAAHGFAHVVRQIRFELGQECLDAVGGVKITEPGADLAVLLAIVSSLKNKPLPEKLVVFGEVGLAGEVRPVQRGQERLKEAAKLGFTQAIIPRANAPKQKISGMEIIAVERVEEAVERMR